MARYLEIAEDIRVAVDSFLAEYVRPDDLGRFDHTKIAATKLGHIINLAIRACPRGVQHTVRGNIVAKAVSTHCRVSMHACVDDKTGNEYHKIEIQPK